MTLRRASTRSALRVSCTGVHELGRGSTSGRAPARIHLGQRFSGPAPGGTLGTPYVIANVTDPVAPIASPFAETRLVVSGAGDALYTIHHDPDRVYRMKAYPGAKPPLAPGWRVACCPYCMASEEQAGVSEVGLATPRRPRTNVSQIAALIAIGIGAAALFGWWSGVRALTAPLAGVPMVANTATMAMLTGIALWLLSRASLARPARLTARSCAVAVCLIAALTLFEHATGVALRIDNLLAAAPEAPRGLLAGRPSPQTSTAFLLAGAALLTLDRQAGRHRLSDYLALGAGSIAVLALLGYLFEVEAFYGLAGLLPFVGMAVHTAVTLIVLGVGILAARPDRGLAAVVTARDAGGVAARSLLVGLLALAPLAIAIVLGARRGWYAAPVASAAVLFCALVEGIYLILRTARRLSLLDAEARRARERERELRAETTALYEREAVQRAWLQSTLDQLPEGVILVDAHGEVKATNRTVLAMAGTAGASDPPGSLGSFDVCDLDGRPVDLDDRPLARALRTGEVTRDRELLLRQRDGRKIPVTASATPVFDERGTLTGAVVVARDISEQKDLERSREEWVAVVAHDLRQPVSTVTLTTELLIEARGRLTPDKQLAAFERIRGAARRLDRMIDDLLDAARIAVARMTLASKLTDVSAVIASVVDELGTPRGGPRPRVVAQPGQLAWADPDRLHQVLVNLLTNAQKYGEPGTGIEIEVHGDAEMLEVAVTNKGPAISADELPRLFSRFSRTREARESSTPGLGLGLYISKGLVEAHGGRMWVDSVPGRTTFHFTLPRRSGAPAVAEVPAARSEPEHPQLGAP